MLQCKTPKFVFLGCGYNTLANQDVYLLSFFLQDLGSLYGLICLTACLLFMDELIDKVCG